MTSVEKAKPEVTKTITPDVPGPVSLDMVIGEKPRQETRPSHCEGMEALVQLEKNINSIEMNTLLEKLKMELVLNRNPVKRPLEKDVIKDLIEDAKR